MMTVSEGVLTELSANMLGVDDQDTDREQRLDALKETINILCGNLLPALAGKEAVFDIGAPKIEGEEEGFAAPSDDASDASSLRLSFDGEPCDLRLFIKGVMPQDVSGMDS